MSKYAIGVYFRTSMDEVEFADGNLCISIVEDAQTRASKPYVDIRDGSQGRISMSVNYQPSQLLQTESGFRCHTGMVGIYSAGISFPLVLI